MDNVHAAWQQSVPSGYKGIYYNKRTSGTWATPTQIEFNFGAKYSNPQIALDSNNYIYIIFNYYNGAGFYFLKYVKYTSFWTSPVQIDGLAINNFVSLTVDSNDNVHVVNDNGGALRYIKYTKSIDTWGAASIVTTSSSVAVPTISIDSNNNLNVLFYNGSPTDIYLIQNTGSWGSDNKILDASGSDAFAAPEIQSTIYPILNGASINIPTVGYYFTYTNTVGGSVILRYYASDGFTAPLGTKNYSRKAAAALPSNDSNLDNLYVSSEYTNVATVNNIFTDQSATNQYSIQQFKNKGNSSSDNIVVTWVGQSSIAPSASTVYLQIYNRNSGLWETLDSNNAASVNTNFSLSGTKTTSLSNYYDASNWVSCRVYQLAV
jgi:hypothetical protein